MSSPVTAKQMRLSLSANGSVYTVAVVEMIGIELLREGGVEHRYGLRGTEPDDRHKVGQKRAKFTLRRWFKSDPNQGNLFYNIHNNDLPFTLREYIKNSSDFAGLSIGECSSYDYREITGTANDIVGEEISGEGTIWDKIISEKWHGPRYPYEYYICSIGFWTTMQRVGWDFGIWCDQFFIPIIHYEWATCPTITDEFLSQFPIVILGRASSKTTSFTTSELLALKNYVENKGSLFIFADVDYAIDLCVKINQVAALWGCAFGVQINAGSIVVAIGQDGHQLWNIPNVYTDMPIVWDSIPSTVDISKVTVIGVHGANPALVIGNTDRVLLTGYDSVIDEDVIIQNVINFFEANSTGEKTCWFRTSGSMPAYAGEVDMDQSWTADDSWDYYIYLTDSWASQTVEGNEVYDFGSIKNTTYYVRWQAILTAHASYAGDVYCRIYAGTKLTDMTLVNTHHLTAPAGGNSSFAIETVSFSGNYRFLRVNYKSTVGGLCIDPTKLWVNGVWRG